MDRPQSLHFFRTNPPLCGKSAPRRSRCAWRRFRRPPVRPHRARLRLVRSTHLSAPRTRPQAGLRPRLRPRAASAAAPCARAPASGRACGADCLCFPLRPVFAPARKRRSSATKGSAVRCIARLSGLSYHQKGWMHMKQALIVVDYQNDFVTGSLGFSGAETLDGPICEKNTRRAPGGGGRPLYAGYARRGLPLLPGGQMHAHTALRGGHRRLAAATAASRRKSARPIPCLSKHTYGSLALAEHLRGQAYERIELCGLVTDICVLSNAVLARAACPEAEIAVDARAVSSADRAAHERALDALERIYVSVLNRG